MFKNALKNLRGEKSDPDEEGRNMVNCKAQRRVLKKHAVMFAVSFIVTLLLLAFCFQLRRMRPPPLRSTFLGGSGRRYDGTFGTAVHAGDTGSGPFDPDYDDQLYEDRHCAVLSAQRIGTQQSPPNQIIIGLALFLTLFIMNPVLQEITNRLIRLTGRASSRSRKHLKRR
jgi:flagellar biosynthetic protein FliP